MASNVALNPPSDTMLLPADGTTQSGKVTLDSAASDNVAVSSVSYIATGGPDNGTVVSAGFPSLYGWLGQWNTTTVPNGIYTLQSVATDTEGFSTTSAPITVRVDNPPPTTAMLIPTDLATQSGGAALLDASASANVSSVNFVLNGSTLTNDVISAGLSTLYGWLGQWNTMSVPNGTYTLESSPPTPTG